MEKTKEGKLKQRILFPFICRNHKQWVRRVSARRAIDEAKKVLFKVLSDADECLPNGLPETVWCEFKEWFADSK